MSDPPGAALDSQIRELGASIVDRTDRLASDVSHNNKQIETLAARMGQVAIISGLCNVALGAAIAVAIGRRLLW
ncbi:MAG: hypothetical protein WBE80_07405 [Methylocella sp.]